MIDLTFVHKADSMPTIRDVRIDVGISQAELAARAEVSKGTIIRLEAGKPVSKDTLLQVCRVLEVDASEVTGVNLFNPVQHRRTHRKR